MSLFTDSTSRISELLFGAPTEPETPIEFDAATEFTIEAGDFILTVFGFWAIVNDVKVNSNGAVGYSTNMVFRSPEGRWIAPRTTYRRWIWQAEVLEVMS